jgi:hypothetical protein
MIGISGGPSHPRGRRKSVHGSNACVRRVTKGATHVSHGRTRMYAPGLSEAGNAQLNGHPGLARSMEAKRNASGKTFRAFTFLFRAESR